MFKSTKYTAITNKARFACQIETIIENGRKEITTKEELEKFPIGCIISYLNNDDIFRPGGFIIKFKPEYFIYITVDFSTKYRARYSHIQKMWVGDVYNTRNDFVSIVPATRAETNFPVIVDDVVVHYATSNYDAKRFKHTDKYLTMMKWCEYFE